MFKFPKDLYVDVRLEESFDTNISFKQDTLQSQKVRTTKGAFVRVFDGQRWYYGSTTDLSQVQAQIDTLAAMATPNPEILEHPLVQAFEVHQERLLRYEENSVTAVPVKEKQALLESFLKYLDHEAIVNHTSRYVDNKTIKSFFPPKAQPLSSTGRPAASDSVWILPGERKRTRWPFRRAPSFSPTLRNCTSFSKQKFRRTLNLLGMRNRLSPAITLCF